MTKKASNKKNDTSFKAGKPGGPGRPKGPYCRGYDSPSYWLKKYAGYTPMEAARACPPLAKGFRSFAKLNKVDYDTRLTLAQIIAAHQILAVLSDPESKCSALVFDRTDGKVTQPIDHTTDGQSFVSSMTDAELIAQMAKIVKQEAK